MKVNELKKKYLEFFKEKKHAIISSASLIPEHPQPPLLLTSLFSFTVLLNNSTPHLLMVLAGGTFSF